MNKIENRFKRRIWHRPECCCGRCEDNSGFMEYPFDGQELNPTVFSLSGELLFAEDENLIEDTGKPLRVAPPGSLIVMDCTGRRDKHGKLIYESDLVKVYISYFAIPSGGFGYHDGEEFEEEHYGVVKFTPSKGFWMKPFMAENILTGRAIKPKSCTMVSARTEIIGNIYEDSNLFQK